MNRLARPSGPARGALVARGVGYVAVIVALIAVMCARFAGAFVDYVHVTALLESAGDALVKGSDVKVNGVVVGRVGSIVRGEGPNDANEFKTAGTPEGLSSVLGTRGAKVELRLFKDQAEAIPAEVTARSLPANFFGQAFVELLPSAVAGATPGESLPGFVERQRAAGQNPTIYQDHSLETAQLQEVFDKLYRVLTAIQPAKLQAALGALAEALDGRGTKVNQLIAHTDAYLKELAPGLPDLRHDITAFADFAGTIDAQGGKLLDSVDDLLVTARTVVARQQALVDLLSAGLDLTEDASSLVSDNERRAVRVADQGREIINALSQHPPAFSDAFVDLGRFLGGLSTRNNGRIGLDTLIGSGPLRPYGPADCPRYPDLDGPNCPKLTANDPPVAVTPARAPAAAPPGTAIRYGGTVGSLGSLPEKLTLAALLAALGHEPGATYGDVGVLLAGSLLRGELQGVGR